MRTRISQRQFKIIVEMLCNMNKKTETTVKDNKRFIPISPFDKPKQETIKYPVGQK